MPNKHCIPKNMLRLLVVVLWTTAALAARPTPTPKAPKTTTAAASAAQSAAGYVLRTALNSSVVAFGLSQVRTVAGVPVRFFVAGTLSGPSAAMYGLPGGSAAKEANVGFDFSFGGTASDGVFAISHAASIDRTNV